MMPRQGFVLIPSWIESDGYRPAVLTEGKTFLEKADFLLDMDLYEATAYLRSLNALRGLDKQALECLLKAVYPGGINECIVCGMENDV